MCCGRVLVGISGSIIMANNKKLDLSSRTGFEDLKDTAPEHLRLSPHKGSGSVRGLIRRLALKSLKEMPEILETQAKKKAAKAAANSRKPRSRMAQIGTQSGITASTKSRRGDGLARQGHTKGTMR